VHLIPSFFPSLTQRWAYLSALPGKIIQPATAIPLVLTDDVDKIGRRINGDPASGLLEMRDPKQNNGFLDY
jgi:ATP-dependent Lon protease